MSSVKHCSFKPCFTAFKLLCDTSVSAFWRMSHLGTTSPEIRQSSRTLVLNILMLQEMSKEGRQALAYWLLIESKVRSVIDEQHYYANYLMKPKDVFCPLFQVNIISQEQTKICALQMNTRSYLLLLTQTLRGSARAPIASGPWGFCSDQWNGHQFKFSWVWWYQGLPVVMNSSGHHLNQLKFYSGEV